MKTKQIIASVLTSTLCIATLSACAGKETNTPSESTAPQQSEESKQKEESSQAPQQSENSAEETKDSALHTLLIRDGEKHAQITATFLNTSSGSTKKIVMTKTEEDDDHTTFTCENDTSLYNMVYLSYGEDTVTKPVAFNRFTCGWYLKDSLLLPYAEGMDLRYDPDFETKTFSFDGYEKTVYIWTPKDYDKNAAEKYSTIYLFDGQTVLTTGVERGMDNDKESWNVSESVECMMSQTDNKAILVCIATGDEHRSDELIPDIGTLREYPEEPLESSQRGNAFADFVCDTIMPYVQENYNVYDDAAHTSLAGSSFGGLETFYAAISHPDKFGTAGVMSPSFQVFEPEAWVRFLQDKTSPDSAPLLYFYAGAFSGDNGDVAEMIYNMLRDMGYPKEKLLFEKYEDGKHTPTYWRNIFPEFLEAMFTQKAETITCGVPVEYIYRISFDDIPKDVSISPDDPRLSDKNNYIYFDNSETKWEQVYAYWWDALPTNKISGALYDGPWPGHKMEQIEGTDIYRIIMPMGPTMIVFSSGVTDDEVAKGVYAYQTADMPYSDRKNAGQIFRIDTSKEAKPGRKSEKTKFVFPEGGWFEYHD